MPQSILEMAKDLVTVQITAGQMPPDTMQEALQRTYTSLMALKVQEETGATSPVETPQPVDWRKSITRHEIRCLECGQSFKQMSGKHLRAHDLDGRSYRVKYGMPRTQPLSARSVTAMRKTITQRVRPWEKAPRYVQAQEAKAQEEQTAIAKKTGRKRAAKA